MAHSSRSYDVKLAPSKALKHADFDSGQQKTLKTPKRKKKQSFHSTMSDITKLPTRYFSKYEPEYWSKKMP